MGNKYYNYCMYVLCAGFTCLVESEGIILSGTENGAYCRGDGDLPYVQYCKSIEEDGYSVE